MFSSTFATSLFISSLFSAANARRRDGIPSHSSHWNETNIHELAEYCKTSEDNYIVLLGVTFGEKVIVNFGNNCNGIAGQLKCAELTDALNICRNNPIKVLLEMDYPEPALENSGLDLAQQLADHFLDPDSTLLVFPVDGFLTGKTMTDDNIKKLIEDTRQLQKTNSKINPIVTVHRNGPHDQIPLLHEPDLNIKAVFLNLYGTRSNRVPTPKLAFTAANWKATLGLGFKIELNLVDAEPRDIDNAVLAMERAEAKYLKFSTGSLAYLDEAEKLLREYEEKKASESTAMTNEVSPLAKSLTISTDASNVAGPMTNTPVTSIESSGSQLSTLQKVTTAENTGTTTETTQTTTETTQTTTETTRTTTETRLATSTTKQCESNGACHLATATNTYVIQIEICASRPRDCVACQPQEERSYKCLQGDCPANEIEPVTTTVDRLATDDDEHTHAPKRKSPVATRSAKPLGGDLDASPDQHGTRSARAAQPQHGELPGATKKHAGVHDAYAPSSDIDTTIQVTSYVIVRATPTNMCTINGKVDTCLADQSTTATIRPKSTSTGIKSNVIALGAKPTFEVFEGGASKFTISALFAGAFFFVAFA